MRSGSFTFGIKHQLILLVFIAIGLNVNTIFHEYVLDDVIVMTENKFVGEGIKGIPKIISQSYVKGYNKLDELEFSGGRYRPVALIALAIEYQFFGANPMVSHLINILLFALLIALLYKLLQAYIFREQNKYLAFVTCLLFAVHPIHTEVIANVKSSDELITFILLIISLTTLIQHSEKKSIAKFLIGLFCFFLALLTRETAVTFIGIVPLVLYFFFYQSIKKAVLFSIPLIFVFIGYMLLRYMIVGINYFNPVNDVTNAPYLYATATEAFATKVFILFKYIGLLFFPYPLSFEYGFNQIPYIDVKSMSFILSLVLMLSLIAYAFFTFKKRSLASFCILYFMITISLVSNFVVDIGTPLAERFLFQPSLAFCILVATFFFTVQKKFKILANVILIFILLLFSVKTVHRNGAWKNYETLVLTDIISSPNSVRINQFATNIFLSKVKIEENKKLKEEYLKKAAGYGEQMIKICPPIPDLYMRLGYTYFYLFDYTKAAELWKKGCGLEPTELAVEKASEVLSTVLYKQGNSLYEQEKLDEAILCYQKSIELNNKNVEAWYNLGGNYFLKNDTTNANKAWCHVKELNPHHSFKKEDF